MVLCHFDFENEILSLQVPCIGKTCNIRISALTILGVFLEGIYIGD